MLRRIVTAYDAHAPEAAVRTDPLGLVAMDYQIEQWINTGAGSNGAVDGVMVAVAQWSQLAFIVLVAGWFLFGLLRGVEVDRVGALSALIAAGLAFATNQVISHFWARPRPFTSHPGVHLLIPHSADASFPSDHVATAVAISVMLLAIHRRLGILVLAISLLVGYARVYVGDHYPGDVVGGLVVGGIAAAVIGAVRVPDLLARLDFAIFTRAGRRVA